MKNLTPQSARPRPWRRVARWTAIGLLVALAVFLLTPIGRYLLRAAVEEGKILARRRPITEVVAAPGTDPRVRDRLRLVVDARRFAVDSVGLVAKESFTTYSPLERDTLVLVLSAAYRDRLEGYSWWFPIVGRVPYKGFFDFDVARSTAKEFRDRGLDTYLRPASAFSTLGWFNDPLLSTTLRLDTLDLANTVIHELVHNTFFARGKAVFNESFANFVGTRGAQWFFRTRGNAAAAERVELEWQDEKRMAAFWTRLHGTLDSAYKANPSDSAARVRAADSVYARARRELVEVLGPTLATIDAQRLGRIQLDNAALLARRIYLTDLEVFDRVYEREGHDLKRSMSRIMALAKDADDPFTAIARWLEQPDTPDGPPASATLP